MSSNYKGFNLTYREKVARDLVKGVYSVDKFGLVGEVTAATDPLDVWEGESIYTLSADGSGDTVGVDDINSISSSSALDTMEIAIQGLTKDGVELVQYVTLQGTTRVELPVKYWRVYRMYNNGTSDINGNVYCYAGTDNTAGVPSGSSVEKARIVNGNNQTLMAIYTIPKDKVGFLYKGEIGISKEGNAGSAVEFARVQYKSRRYGKVFRVKKDLSLMPSGSSLFQDYRNVPDVIPDLTDIKIHVKEVSDTMGIWATFDILIEDKDRFSPEFLAAIGQSGY